MDSDRLIFKGLDRVFKGYDGFQGLDNIGFQWIGYFGFKGLDLVFQGPDKTFSRFFKELLYILVKARFHFVTRKTH
jgi:hypothetical protein